MICTGANVWSVDPRASGDADLGRALNILCMQRVETLALELREGALKATLAVELGREVQAQAIVGRGETWGNVDSCLKLIILLVQRVQTLALELREWALKAEHVVALGRRERAQGIVGGGCSRESRAVVGDGDVQTGREVALQLDDAMPKTRNHGRSVG